MNIKNIKGISIGCTDEEDQFITFNFHSEEDILSFRNGGINELLSGLEPEKLSISWVSVSVIGSETNEVEVIWF